MLRRLDEGDTMSDAMMGVFDSTSWVRLALWGIGRCRERLACLDRLREQHKGRGDAVAELVRPAIYLTFALILYAFFAAQGGQNSRRPGVVTSCRRLPFTSTTSACSS